MRSGATEALKSVWLPPTLCEYRDYVGAATVCVGAARDARHDTRCRDCGHGVSCNCGDGVVQDKENIGTATVAAVAVSDPHLSPLPPLSTATEYALQLLHLSRGARVENPLSDVPRLAHLADVYYSQSSALAHAMRLEERRREWEHYHALMRHPSLTRLHCTPIRVHESRDENFDGRDDSDSEDDEEVGGGGVAESETPTAKHARWVQYVAGLPPPPATRSRLERLSLQFHPKVSTPLDVGMFTHLRDLRVYTRGSDDSHIDPMMATLAASVASESGRLEYVQFSVRYGISSSQKLGFRVESATTALSSEGDGGDSDRGGEETERKDHGGNRETKRSGSSDGSINASDGIEGSGDDCGDGNDREPVTHAFLWLPDERRTVVLLPHTRAHDANLHAHFSDRRTTAVYNDVRRRLGVDRIGASLAALLRRRTIVSLGTENGAPRPAHSRPRLIDAKTCATWRRGGRVASACYCDATASVIGACVVSQRRRSPTAVSSSLSSAAARDRSVATSTSFAEMWPPTSATKGSATGKVSAEPSTTTRTVSQSGRDSLATDGAVVVADVVPRFQYVHPGALLDVVVPVSEKFGDADDGATDSDGSGGDDDAVAVESE